MDSVRLQRILAEDLARRGFAVLHFDYLGTGDSAYEQGRDDAVAQWVASVGHALDYLTLIGAEPITAIGIRAGCLILDEYLTKPHTLTKAVYLDPPGTGKRYLREHSTLYRLSVGADAAIPGVVSIIGARFSELAATQFAALQLHNTPSDACGLDSTLVVGRPGETDKHITTFTAATGVTSVVTEGLPECAQPRETLVPVPFTAIDSIVEWIDENTDTQTSRAEPQYLTTVTMPAEGPDGVDVVESIELLEPNRLFVIRTLPRNDGPSPEKTVLFFVTANDSHVGPAREWVELSRRLASTGSQAVRWDPMGLGLSGKVSRDAWRGMYSKRDIADSVRVAEHVRPGDGKLELVGICSGSWYAAHVARKAGAQSAILINLMAWNWRVTSTLFSQWNTRRKTLYASTGEQATGALSEYRRRRLGAILRPFRERTKDLMHAHLPRPALRGLSKIGLVWMPEEVLTTLANRGTDVTVIASPEDAELLASKGGESAFARLLSSPHPPELKTISPGDHAAHHPAILSAIRCAVLPTSAESTSVPEPEPEPVPMIAPTDGRQTL